MRLTPTGPPVAVSEPWGRTLQHNPLNLGQLPPLRPGPLPLSCSVYPRTRTCSHTVRVPLQSLQTLELKLVLRRSLRFYDYLISANCSACPALDHQSEADRHDIPEKN